MYLVYFTSTYKMYIYMNIFICILISLYTYTCIYTNKYKQRYLYIYVWIYTSYISTSLCMPSYSIFIPAKSLSKFLIFVSTSSLSSTYCEISSVNCLENEVEKKRIKNEYKMNKIAIEDNLKIIYVLGYIFHIKMNLNRYR
jgi:hypothetical protein